MTPPNDAPPPRTRAWTAFALVGLVAGVVTIVLLVLLARRLRGG